MTRLAEEHATLWILTASPAIWAAHLLLSYVLGAIWCAKVPDDSFLTVRLAIGAFTIVALIGIVMVGWIGYRAHGYGGETAPHDADSPEDRHRFLGFATLLLSGLSAVAVSYAALVAVFVESCY